MSTLAPQVDGLYYFIYYVSVAAFLVIVGVMVVFVIRYRRRPGVKAQPTGHSNALEVAWTVAPVFLLAHLFHAGWQGYLYGAVAPPDAMDIHVVGKQWTWEFVHMPSGVQESSELTVPVHQPKPVPTPSGRSLSRTQSPGGPVSSTVRPPEV